jgi:hypothetical protein
VHTPATNGHNSLQNEQRDPNLVYMPVTVVVSQHCNKLTPAILRSCPTLPCSSWDPLDSFDRTALDRGGHLPPAPLAY